MRNAPIVAVLALSLTAGCGEAPGADTAELYALQDRAACDEDAEEEIDRLTENTLATPAVQPPPVSAPSPASARLGTTESLRATTDRAVRDVDAAAEAAVAAASGAPGGY